VNASIVADATDTLAVSMQDSVTDPRSTALWAAVDRLLERATLDGILVHKLGPLAANRLRRLGEPVPRPLVLEERAAAVSMLTAVPLLERIRELHDGRLLLLKGPDVARLYPGTARRFGDLDLLFEDAAEVHATLAANGFVEVEDPDFEFTPDHHHLQPLRWPTLPLLVEVHKAPNWPASVSRPPSLDELDEASMPSVLGLDGVRTPSPLHHALILAVHAWSHVPLHTLRDLIDVAAVAAPLDDRELELAAKRWGVGRIWRSTKEAIDGVFYGGRTTPPLRTWARHLERVGRQSILEKHVAGLLHPYWEAPAHRATLSLARALGDAIRPLPGETWGEKLARIGRAVRDPRAPVGRR
jgi:hypothetical protein